MNYRDEIKILFERLGRSNNDLGAWHLFELTTVCWTRMLFVERPLARSSEEEMNELEEFTRIHAVSMPWVQRLKYAEKSTILRLCVILCRLRDNAQVRALLAEFDNHVPEPEEPAPLVLRASISSAIVPVVDAAAPLAAPLAVAEQPEQVHSKPLTAPSPSPPPPPSFAPTKVAHVDVVESLPAMVPPCSSAVTSTSTATTTTTKARNKRRIESDDDDDDDDERDEDEDFVSPPTTRVRAVSKKQLLSSDSNFVALPEPPLVTEFIRVNAVAAAQTPSSIIAPPAAKKKKKTTITSARTTSGGAGTAKELPTTRIDMRVDPKSHVYCSCGNHKATNLAVHRQHVIAKHRNKEHGGSYYCPHDCAFWTVRTSALETHLHQMHHQSSRIAACPVDSCTEIYGDPKNKGKYPHLRRTFSTITGYHVHMEKTHKWSAERELAETNRQEAMSAAEWKAFIALGPAPAIINVPDETADDLTT